jgi:hypothetical protein
MINTIDYGMIPVAKDRKYLNNNVIGTVETCDGNFYTIHKAFSGAIVALLNND